jgi:acetyl esterase/lipase
MGHSIGGAAAAQALQQDRRIRGGVDLDGRLFSPVLDPSSPPSAQQRQRNRPLMLLGREKHADEDPTWDQFWRSNKATSAVMLGVKGTSHSSFTDVPVLVEALGLPEEARSRVEAMLGVVGGRRMQQILVELSSSFSTWAFGGGYRRLVEAAGGLKEVVVRKSSFEVV